MKKFPYYAEEIQLEAIKCKHRGEWLEKPVEKIIDESHRQEDHSDSPDDEQKRVMKCTKIALIFSLLWLVGIGSLIAIIYSYKALKTINHSANSLSGKGMAIFSLILGILGISFWGFIFLGAIISRM